MSIANEIQRLQAAKANIKTAIENKGVTVGDGTIDTYATLIEQITGGGGSLPSNITAINGGTWTQETSLGNGGTLDIEHGLTDIPDLIFITCDSFDVLPTGYSFFDMFYEKSADSVGYDVYYNGAITTRVHYQYGGAQQGITSVDNNKFTITTASNRQLPAGVTYSWTAVSFTEGVEVDPSYDYNQGYDQGYEDGKNSVVQLERYLKTATFTSLNIFGAREVVLNLDNATTLQNLFNIGANDDSNENITVEQLTINMSKTTSFMQAFYCHSTVWDNTLKRITLNLNTSSCTSFANAFTNLRGLEIIDGTPFDFTSATNVGAMFNYCNSLVEVRFAPNTLVKSISLSNSDKLSTETIQSIIDGLATVDTAQTLTLHANLKILQSQVDSANAKGWTVAGGTVVSEEEYYA